MSSLYCLQIRNGMLSVSESLNTGQFGSLFTLGVFDIDVVKEFLEHYEFPETLSINDSEWMLFLNEIMSACKKARHHSILITHFLQPALALYSRGGKDKESMFLSNLLELSYNVPGLFTTDEDCIEDAKQVTVDFTEFVKRTLTMDALDQVISKKCGFFEVR